VRSKSPPSVHRALPLRWRDGLEIGYLLSGSEPDPPPLPHPVKDRGGAGRTDPPPSKGAATHTKVRGREGGGRVPLSERRSKPSPRIKALLYISSVESASIRARLPPQVFGPPLLEASRSSKREPRVSNRSNRCQLDGNPRKWPKSYRSPGD